MYRMSPLTLRKLAQRIKQLRVRSGLTQEEFAEKVGIKYKYYQEYEGKNPRDIRFSTLEKIAKGLKLPLWKLLQIKE